MRVLQIFNTYVERGGEEVIVERISDGLGEGCEVDTLQFSSTRLKAYHSWKLVGVFFQMFWNPGALKQVTERVETFKPDVVLLHNFMPIGSYALLGHLKALDLPVVYLVHNYRPYSVNGYLWGGGRCLEGGIRKNYLGEIATGSWQNSKIKTAAYAVVLWWSHLTKVWDKVDRWIAISDFVSSVLVRAGVPEEKIRTLPHCHCGTVQALPFAHAEKPHFLYLGRLTEAKGIRELLEAWRVLKAEGFDGVLDIAGEGDLEQEVRSAADGLEDCVFHGFVKGERKKALLTSCVALLAPSMWWEAFGLVALDAYSCGRPVVAANSGGLRETVFDGETGWLYEPGDVAGLAAAMRTAAADPDEAERRGKAGLKWLLEHGDEAKWRADLQGLLAEVAGKEVR